MNEEIKAEYFQNLPFDCFLAINLLRDKYMSENWKCLGLKPWFKSVYEVSAVLGSGRSTMPLHIVRIAFNLSF